MKRQLTAAALALLCLGTPGVATERDDVILAAKRIGIAFKDSGCKRVVRTERLGVDQQSLVATCDNGEAYLISGLTNAVPVIMQCIAIFKEICDPKSWPKPGDVVRDEPPLPKPARPAPVAAKEDHDGDRAIAAHVIFRHGFTSYTSADCPVVVHTERKDGAIFATCSNKEVFLVGLGNEPTAWKCTENAREFGMANPCLSRRRLPNIYRGAAN